MSSSGTFNIRALKEISSDPLQQKIDNLARQVSKFVTSQITVDNTEDEDIIADGIQIDEAVKFHDEIYHVKKYDNWTKKYYPLKDFDNLSTWIRGNHLGNNLNDIGPNKNHAFLFGEPKLINGDYDTGYLGGTYKSLAVRFNRPTSLTAGKEWFQILDNTNLQVSGISTGLTFFLRVRIQSFALQNGLNPTLFTKIDDNTPNNAQQLEVNQSGQLIWTVRRSSNNYRVITPIGSPLSLNVVYNIFGTYAVSGNTQKIYIEGTDTSATTDATTPVWQSDILFHDLYLMKRGKGLVQAGTLAAAEDPTGLEGGYTYADFYDFKYWREKVATQQEITNHTTNKTSLTNQPFGQVPFANHCTPDASIIPSFTAASFSSLSFTV